MNKINPLLLKKIMFLIVIFLFNALVLQQVTADQLGNETCVSNSQSSVLLLNQNTTVYSLSDLPDISSDKSKTHEIVLLHDQKAITNQQNTSVNNSLSIIQTGNNININNPPSVSNNNVPIFSSSKMPGDFQLQLNPGWNFLSTPKSLSIGNNTFEIFNNINTASHSIYGHDPVLGWKKIYKTEIFDPYTGIWIYSVQKESISLFYDSGKIDTYKGKLLRKGWNAIGLPSMVSIPTREALSSISDKWVFLIPFNSTTRALDVPIIKGWKGRYSDQYELLPGKGYWIYMSSDGTLISCDKNPDINVTGTVKYKTEMDNGWSFSIPGTIKGSISPETGLISIESSDAVISYGGKTYPLKMNINAFMEQ